MEAPRTSLRDLAVVFLRLGCLSFGGPAVHIAMMEEEIVRRRRWMTRERFLDLVGATNLIPGPNSTEMAMHCGQERAGWRGLVIAGTCFILPAVIITGLLAWGYDTYGHLPDVNVFLYGIKPAVIAVVLSVLISLGKVAVKTRQLAMIGIASATAVMLGFSEIAVLFLAGGVGILLRQARLSSFALIVPAVADTSVWKTFLIFLKIGAILYGSGYVLFAFLEDELVDGGLLTRQELVDAIAAGQITPGPVFSAATFVGWQIAGIKGAMAATAGIFLPAFIFVALLKFILQKLQNSPAMKAFLDSVNVASIAIMFAVIVDMARISVTDWKTVVIALLGFIVSFRFRKLNTAWIIVGGSIAGYGLSFL